VTRAAFSAHSTQRTRVQIAVTLPLCPESVRIAAVPPIVAMGHSRPIAQTSHVE